MAVAAVGCFFGLLLTGRGMNVTQRGLGGTSGLCRITGTGHDVKRVDRGSLLRLRLGMLGTHSALARGRDGLGDGVFGLHSFLTLKRSRRLRPIIPRAVPAILLGCPSILSGTLTGGSFTRGVHHHRLRTSFRITGTGNGLHRVGLCTRMNFAKASGRFGDTCHHLGSGRVIRINFGVPVLS